VRAELAPLAPLLALAACATAAGPTAIAPGRYSAEIPGEQRYIQLESRGDGEVIVRNLGAEHNPPAELEVHVSIANDRLVVRTREGVTLTLVRAPPAQ
jgi:hypothetical protein